MSPAIALQRAIKEAGGYGQLAKYLGTQPATVFSWYQAPLQHCAAIETLTGVTCEELRPDVMWARDINDKVTGHIPSSKFP